ncbi:MAG: hypothetical protein LBJ67_00310 [Planctomycetaceae bacterium]|nr:hypothetical protein [Planctomycetaceae bacterium]
MTGIDDHWDFYAPSNTLKPYIPPDTYNGIFIYGVSPDSISDEKVKKKYLETHVTHPVDKN